MHRCKMVPAVHFDRCDSSKYEIIMPWCWNSSVFWNKVSHWSNTLLQCSGPWSAMAHTRPKPWLEAGTLAGEFSYGKGRRQCYGEKVERKRWPQKTSVLNGLGKWHCHQVLLWDWQQQVWLQQPHILSYAACVHLASVALDKINLIQYVNMCYMDQDVISKDVERFSIVWTLQYTSRELFRFHTKIKRVSQPKVVNQSNIL